MAERLQRIKVGGREVWIDVGDSPTHVSSGDGDLTLTSANGWPDAGEAMEQLENADIAPTIQALVEPVKSALENSPGLREIVVELAIGIKGEVGFFIAKGEANAAIKVSAKWAFPE